MIADVARHAYDLYRLLVESQLFPDWVCFAKIKSGHGFIDHRNFQGGLCILQADIAPQKQRNTNPAKILRPYFVKSSFRIGIAFGSEPSTFNVVEDSLPLKRPFLENVAARTPGILEN